MLRWQQTVPPNVASTQQNNLTDVEVYETPTTPLRNVVCKREAVTAQKWAIGLRPDCKKMLLHQVSASRALWLLRQFQQGYCPMMGQKFSSCDPVPPALRAKVRIEVHQHIVNLPWLQIGQQGTITSVPENFIYVTLDALPATLQVTTVWTAAATLLGIYTFCNLSWVWKLATSLLVLRYYEHLFLKLHVTSSRFCLYLLNICHFTYTFSHAHTDAHTHKHTCTIGTQEEWRQPGTGAWLRGAEERLC